MFNQVVDTSRHQANLVLGAQHAIHNTHEHDHPHVVVKPRVNDQGLQWRFRVALGRRNTANNGFKNLIDAIAGFGARPDRIGRLNANHVFNFLGGGIRVGGRQVHLVQDGNHLYTQLNRRIAVGDRLRLDALARVNYQQSALTGRQ